MGPGPPGARPLLPRANGWALAALPGQVRVHTRSKAHHLSGLFRFRQVAGFRSCCWGCRPGGCRARRAPRRPVQGNSPQVARLRRPDRATYGRVAARAGGCASPRRVQSKARAAADPRGPRRPGGNSPQVARCAARTGRLGTGARDGRRVQSKARAAADPRGLRRPVRGNSPQVARLRRPDRATYGELPARAGGARRGPRPTGEARGGGVAPGGAEQGARARPIRAVRGWGVAPAGAEQGTGQRSARSAAARPGQLSVSCPIAPPGPGNLRTVAREGWRVSVASAGAEQGAGRGRPARSAAGVSPRWVQSKARGRRRPARSAAGVSPRRVQSKARGAADRRGPRRGVASAGAEQDARGWGAGGVGAEQGVVGRQRPRWRGSTATASFLISAVRDIGRIAAKSRSPLGVGIAARRRPPAVVGTVPSVGKRSNGRGTADQLRVGCLPFAASRDPPSRGGA